MIARGRLRTATTRFITRTMFVILLASTGFLVFARESNACSFTRPGSPTLELQKSTYVFAGKVVAVYRVPNDEVYEFKVDTVWKGPLYETTYVVGLLESYAGTSCAGSLHPFTLGRNYLVYDDHHVASRSGLLEQRSEDLAELGKGSSPVPGTKAPLPEILQETRNAPKPGADQSTTPGITSPTPMVTEARESPTPSPRVPTPTRTSEAVTPTLKPTTSAPTPGPSTATPTFTPATATLTPAVTDKQPSLPWPTAVLIAFLAAALIGSVALVLSLRSPESER